MPKTSRNIRFDDDLYKSMMQLAGDQLSGSYHIHLACRQYLARLEPIEELATKPITKPKPKMKKFIPPTVEEASNYFNDKGSTVHEAEKFIDFYISKDWMVGKNKMKDWKAAARNWLRGKSNGGQNQSGRLAAPNRQTLPERVRSNINKQRLERGVAGLDREDMAETPSNVRLQVHESVRGDAGQHMGQLFEGDYSETDS